MKRRGRPRSPDILTPREWEVLGLLREDLSNDAIAERLRVSTETVKSHVGSVLLKLGVENRHEAARWRPEPREQRAWFGPLGPADLLARLKLHAVVYAVGLTAIAVAGILVGLLVWGVTHNASTSGAITSGRTDPALIIFTTLAQSSPKRRAVSVYDTTSSSVLYSFEIGDGIDESPQQVVVAGDKLVANLGNRIVRYDLDGSHPQELRHANQAAGTEASFAPRFIGIGASPDGRYIALTEQTGDLCPEASAKAAHPDATPVLCLAYADVTSVTVITTATGASAMSVRQSDPGFAGYHGQAGAITWRDDGRGFVVAGYTYSEGGGSLATVMLDGSVKTHADERADLAPNGRYVDTGAVALVCGLGGTAVQHEIVVRRLDDASTLAAVSDPVLNLSPQEWAPDGSELLYSTATLVPSPANFNCVEEDQTSLRWYVLRTDGSPPVSVPDRSAARRAWYGDRLVEFRCNGQPLTARYYAYSDPPCLAANDWDAPIEADVGGQPIGSGLNWHTVQLVPPNNSQRAVN